MAKQKSPAGWHREDIKAAIWKRGTTLTQLAQDSGLNSSLCCVALIKPNFAGEQAIATFLGVDAQ